MSLLSIEIRSAARLSPVRMDFDERRAYCMLTRETFHFHILELAVQERRADRATAAHWWTDGVRVATRRPSSMESEENHKIGHGRRAHPGPKGPRDPFIHVIDSLDRSIGGSCVFIEHPERQFEVGTFSATTRKTYGRDRCGRKHRKSCAKNTTAGTSHDWNSQRDTP